MIVTIVEVSVKPGMEAEFLDLIREDAEKSEALEPGCLRFDVLQDAEKPSTYYFYEVYADQAAADAHRVTPHLQRIDARIPDLFDGASIHIAKNIIPDDANFRR